MYARVFIGWEKEQVSVSLSPVEEKFHAPLYEERIFA